MVVPSSSTVPEPEIDSLEQGVGEADPRGACSWPPLRWMASGRDAIAQALAGIPRTGEVWITSSVGTSLHRLTPCVAEAVSRRARGATTPSERTVAVLLVHEWGFPHPERTNIVQLARERGWRIVDDCAHAFALGLDLARRGAIVAFSLPKFFPVATGGLLAGEEGLSMGELLDTTSLPWPRLQTCLDHVAVRSAAHVTNWHRLRSIAAEHGFAAVDDLPEGVIPQVFRIAVRRQFAAQQAFASRGIETTPPFYVGWLALPCHADLPADYWNSVRQTFRDLAVSTSPEDSG